MVESNKVEERLARIERMVEALQRESATIKRVASDMLDVVATALIPTSPPPSSKRKP